MAEGIDAATVEAIGNVCAGRMIRAARLLAGKGWIPTPPALDSEATAAGFLLQHLPSLKVERAKKILKWPENFKAALDNLPAQT